jgi:hypothetical protein
MLKKALLCPPPHERPWYGLFIGFQIATIGITTGGNIANEVMIYSCKIPINKIVFTLLDPTSCATTVRYEYF